jgi:hypothetical protein
MNKKFLLFVLVIASSLLLMGCGKPLAGKATAGIGGAFDCMSDQGCQQAFRACLENDGCNALQDKAEACGNAVTGAFGAGNDADNDAGLPPAGPPMDDGGINIPDDPAIPEGGNQEDYDGAGTRPIARDEAAAMAGCEAIAMDYESCRNNCLDQATVGAQAMPQDDGRAQQQNEQQGRQGQGDQPGQDPQVQQQREEADPFGQNQPGPPEAGAR